MSSAGNQADPDDVNKNFEVRCKCGWRKEYWDPSRMKGEAVVHALRCGQRAVYGSKADFADFTDF